MQQVTSASILLTEDCNMACSFCYEQGKSPDVMSKETVEQAVDFIARHRSPDRLFLMWFGGEPLLAFDLLKHGLKYAQEVTPDNLTHLITTNGTIWNQEIEQLFLDHQNLSLQLSWLGLPELQNEERGCADLVEANVKHIIRAIPNKIQVQLQVVPNVVFKLKETIDYIAKIIGDRGKIYVRPVPEAEGWLNSGVLEMFEAQMAMACKEHRTLLKKVCDAQEGLTSDKLYCDAGRRFFSIAPTGDIYPCHRLYFQRDSALKLGHIKTGMIRSNIADMLETCTRDSVLGCSDCSAYEYCYICPACNYESTGNFFTPTYQNCAVNRAFVAGLKSYIERFKPPPETISIVREPNINTEEILYQVFSVLMNLNESIATLSKRMRKIEEQVKFIGRL